MSSFVSVDGLKSCFYSSLASKSVVIRNSFCGKEMTTMTTFLGVRGSCSPDWDTKVSASVPRPGKRPGRRRRFWRLPAVADCRVVGRILLDYHDRQMFERV